MDFKNILNGSKKGELLLGYNNDDIYKVDLHEYNSIIITGSTGSGKSILLDQIILQMINNYTSLELEIIPIDTSGVELNYYAESKYCNFSAINDVDKGIVGLSRVFSEVLRRKELLKQTNSKDIDEYNKFNDEEIPYLLVAIDDDKFLLRNDDVEKMLSSILGNLSGLNILFVLATGDVFNKFFKLDYNVLANLLISFDLSNSLESKYNNVPESNNLELGTFIVKANNKTNTYHSFAFDDKLIEEITGK